MKNKFLLGFFILALLCFFPGCQDREEALKVDLSQTEEIKDLFAEAPGIRIGLVPEEDIRKLAARYEPLAEYLSRKLKLKVTLVYLDNYGEVCDKFIYKQLDAAFFGSFSYALTHAKAGVEPIARPDYHGVSTYRGLIVVRKDGPVKKIADMRQKRLALVHKATYAGYLYPLYYFMVKGSINSEPLRKSQKVIAAGDFLEGQGIKDLEGYFSKVVFYGSHDKAVFALLRNEADVACPKDLIYQKIIAENPNLARQLVVLSVSDPVPSNALCVSQGLDPSLKSALKEALLNLNNDLEAKPVLEALGAVSFIETKDPDYQILYNIISELGIDLNTYPYYARPDMGFDRDRKDDAI